MTPPLHFFLLSLFFTNISYVIGDFSDSSSTNCPAYSSCDDGVPIKYPFWRAEINTTSNQYCGYPSFGLSCANGKTTLRLPDGDRTFHVKEINYASHSITVADTDHGTNQNCPRPRHNHTLENLPLNYSNLDLTLSFYFNCTQNPFWESSTLPIDCLRFETKQSYVTVLTGDEKDLVNWFGICEENVRVMVLKAPDSGLDWSTEFAGAIGQGFVLDWGTATGCGDCENSDGRCGHSTAKKDLLCFCKDGKVRSKNCRGHNLNVRLKIIVIGPA